MHPEYLIFVAAALAVSWLCTLLVRRLALRFGLVCQPTADRWHTRPVALHGGVGFCLPFFLLAAAWLALEHGDLLLDLSQFNDLPASLRLALASLAGGLFMFLCGLYDDFRRIRPLTKLIYQIIAASLVIYAGGLLPLSGVYGVDLVITFLWFIGVTNATNLLDNMDGLSSGVAFISASTVAAISVSAPGQTPVAGPLATLFAACLLGFWLHNKPPARIFMGDSGSLAMGYILAALALPTSMNGLDAISLKTASERLLVLLIPAALLAVPIFDTTFVTLTRLMRASKVHQGGRDHSSHRLVRLGFSEWSTNLTLYALAGFGGAIALLALRFPDQTVPIFGVFILGLTLFGAYLSVSAPAGHNEEPGAPQSALRLPRGLLFSQTVPQLLLDTVLIITCFWGAYLLRFDFNLAPFLKEAMIQALPVVVASCLLGLRLAGAYRGSWRMASVSDLPSFGMAALLGTSISLSLVTIFSRFGEGYSRSAYIIFGFLFFLAISLSRMSFRMLDTTIKKSASSQENGIPVIIYGAGKAGKILFEETIFSEELADYHVVGFVDDDERLQGSKVCGRTVKNKEHWAYVLEEAPEIWISSQAIGSGRAREFSRLWSPPAPVRRLYLRLEEVQ